MEDVEATQLLKAINHLRYLHEDFGVAESECRLVNFSTVLVSAYLLIARAVQRGRILLRSRVMVD